MQRRQSILLTMALGFALAFAAVPASAVEPDEIRPDAAMEQRARELSAGLRCLVCQNQSIDDSHAPLARDLRLLVRERIKAGDSNEAVLDFVVARYGDFVLLKPPMRGSTLILWPPPVVVLIGGILLARAARRNATKTSSGKDELSADEAARLEKILKRDS
jgi:cytochrome c-type biogenesis protein CcmH